MTYLLYEHHNARSRLSAECVNSIETILTSIEIPKPRIATKHIRKTILDKLQRDGWSGEAKLDALSSITITSVKDSVGLCLQTGNMARIYADMLKLQLLFSRKKIIGAVFLLFSRLTANALGDNIASYERLTKELGIFGEVIGVPVLVFGLEIAES